MKAMTRRVLSLVGVAGLAGCAAANPPADPFGGGGPRPIRVEVMNNNFNDATIYANYAAERVRLGTVTGKASNSFTLRTRVAQPIYMEIDMVGGQRCVTDLLTVDEGDVLYLEIAIELSSMRECRR